MIGAGSSAWSASAAPDDRASRWQEDLDAFETNLPQKHIDFYKLIPKQIFEHEMADIRSSIPQLSDVQIVLGLVRLSRTRRESKPPQMQTHSDD
jgi:hypothetical protein